MSLSIFEKIVRLQQVLNKPIQIAQWSEFENKITIIAEQLVLVGQIIVNGHYEYLSSVNAALAELGWFANPYMTLAVTEYLADAIKKKDFDQIDKIMKNFITEQFDEIEAMLVSYSTKRKRVLTAAFQAHRNQEYALSVPILISQSEGIWKDFIGINADLFGMDRESVAKGNPIPKSKRYLEQKSGLDDLTIKAFYNPLCIVTSLNQKSADAQYINRHGILHGEHYDYDTEINSLKAISWLALICHLLCAIKEQNNI